MRNLFAMLFGICGAVGSVDGQSVLRVDDTPSPGALFATIQAAIDASVPGDIVLVRPGTYPPFTIDGKGITICYDSSGVTTGSMVVSGSGAVVIRNIPVGQAAMLQNVYIAHGGGVRVESNAGRVWLDQCYLGGGAPAGAASLECTLSADITMTSSTIAGPFILISGPTSPGLRVSPGCGQVTLLDTMVVGNLLAWKSVFGGDAAFVFCERFFASHCVFAGGNGGPGYGAGMPGGDALFLSTQQGATLVGCEFVPGKGGGVCQPLVDCGFSGQPPYGMSGQGLVPIGGPLDLIDSVPHGLIVKSPVRETNLAELTVTCGAGELAWLLVSAGPAPALQLSGVLGPLLVDVNTAASVAGPFPIACTGDPVGLSLQAPVLPSSIQGKDLYFQCVFSNAGLTQLRVDAAAAVVVLKSAH